MLLPILMYTTDVLCTVRVRLIVYALSHYLNYFRFLLVTFHRANFHGVNLLPKIFGLPNILHLPTRLLFKILSTCKFNTCSAM